MKLSPPHDPVVERTARSFVRWYIKECQRMKVPCNCEAYDLPDAYADWMESMR